MIRSMKRHLVLISLIALGGCGPSREAMQALDLMLVREAADRPGLSYARLSGSAGEVTLEDVSVLPSDGLAGMLGLPAAADAADALPARLRAETVVMKGLSLRDGRPVVRDMIMSGIVPADPVEGMDVRTASLALEGRSPAAGAFVASAFTEEGSGAPPPFADWAFSRIGMNGMSLKGSFEGEDGPTRFDVRLADVSASDLKDKTIGRLRIAGLAGELQVPTVMIPLEASFDLGDIEIAALRPDLFLGPLATAFAGLAEAGAAPADAPASPLEAGYDRLSWSGMKLDVSGLSLSMTPLTHTLTRDAAGLAIGSDLPRTSLTLRADQSGGMAGAMGLMVLAMAGYPSDRIELFAEGRAAFDPLTDLTRFSGYTLGLTDVASLRLDMGLNGVRQSLPALVSVLEGAAALVEAAPDVQDNPQRDPGQTPPDTDAAPGEDAAAAIVMQLLFALMPLQLTDLDLTLEDERLMELILTQQARASDQSPEALRRDLVALAEAAPGFMSDAGIDPAIATELSAAMAGMAAGPGTMRLQLRPKQPFGMLSAMMAPVTKDSLGFSASFSARAAARASGAAPEAKPVPAN